MQILEKVRVFSLPYSQLSTQTIPFIAKISFTSVFIETILICHN